MEPLGCPIMTVRSDPPPGKIGRTESCEVALEACAVERRQLLLKRRGRWMERDIGHRHLRGVVWL